MEPFVDLGSLNWGVKPISKALTGSFSRVLSEMLLVGVIGASVASQAVSLAVCTADRITAKLSGVSGRYCYTSNSDNEFLVWFLRWGQTENNRTT